MAKRDGTDVTIVLGAVVLLIGLFLLSAPLFQKTRESIRRRQSIHSTKRVIGPVLNYQTSPPAAIEPEEEAEPIHTSVDTR